MIPTKDKSEHLFHQEIAGNHFSWDDIDFVTWSATERREVRSISPTLQCLIQQASKIDR